MSLTPLEHAYVHLEEKRAVKSHEPSPYRNRAEPYDPGCPLRIQLRNHSGSNTESYVNVINKGTTSPYDPAAWGRTPTSDGRIVEQRTGLYVLETHDGFIRSPVSTCLWSKRSPDLLSKSDYETYYVPWLTSIVDQLEKCGVADPSTVKTIVSRHSFYQWVNPYGPPLDGKRLFSRDCISRFVCRLLSHFPNDVERLLVEGS